MCDEECSERCFIPYLQHSVFLCVFQNEFTPSEVVQWSNHRVMEWLRSVDLAEYAPNLRGSGVHGGLVVSTRDHTAYGSKNKRTAESILTTSLLS